MSVSAPQVPITSATQSPQDSASQSEYELVIEARRGWIAIDWDELYRYRELLVFLIWRDLKVRYKQSILGVAWAVLVPLLSVMIYKLIFDGVFHLGRDVKDGAGNLVPYIIFVYSAMLPWLLFSNSVSQGGLSLLNQQHLLTKIYFPRLFLPTAVVGAMLVDLLISLGVYAALMIFYHFTSYAFTPNWGLAFFPLLVLLVSILSLGAAYTLSAITVTYRDVRFLVPFVVQILMWVSFVPFPIPKEIAENHPTALWIASLNPMFGIIDAFRAAALGTTFHPGYLVVSIVISVALFVFGLFYFRRTERRFADIA